MSCLCVVRWWRFNWSEVMTRVSIKSLQKGSVVHTRPSKAFCAARVRTFMFPFAMSQSMAGHV